MRLHFHGAHRLRLSGRVRRLFLGMGDDFEDVVGVANDLEVEPPALVDPRLPAIANFVVFLGMEERVVEVLKQEINLFKECLANGSAFSKCAGSA